MIKFIIFLPFRIVGLLFVTIGAALDRQNRRKLEREKQKAAAWKEEHRIAKEQNARIEKEKRERCKLEKQAAADRARTEKEKARQAEKRRKEQERKKALQFKVEQAKTDIVHYDIQRGELLKLYNELQRQFDAAGTDRQKEIVFRRQIALNNQIRGVDRQIEKAQYTINKSGPE